MTHKNVRVNAKKLPKFLYAHFNVHFPSSYCFETKTSELWQDSQTLALLPEFGLQTLADQ
ncbi:hypothetical protein [Thalassospira sp.]|uniref:hypothetical protein n=1 Tax=Thalassospira sp. TaxID=1912094 RepID=UPI0025E84828|nr:hypothetical protein [Thalassospira sp.]|tara:strand:- start:114 stop:293 length:180 start_codon:yes stop_codon:yes gene_type:complete